jgi:hypothetical protein
MRKTALLSGVAGLFLMSAPALAQDPAPQTPPATPPAAEAPAQPQSLTLTPGAVVRGSDGQELGKLEGARQTPAGQELTVRGADGQLRGVPTSGLSQEGDVVVAAWSSQQFLAAPAITDAPAAPAPDAETPDAETMPAPDTTATPPSAPAAPTTNDPSASPPTDSAAPPATEQPTTTDDESSTEPDGATPPGA